MKNEDELIKLLTEWFEENKNNTIKPHFWNRNPVAKIIKQYLSIFKRWNVRPRGNPTKGWQEMKNKQIEKQLDKSLDF